jgi:hypothetical protein
VILLSTFGRNRTSRRPICTALSSVFQTPRSIKPASDPQQSCQFASDPQQFPKMADPFWGIEFQKW